MSRLRWFRGQKSQGGPPSSVQRHLEMKRLQGRVPFKLKPHHARPFRVRHVAALGVSVVAILILFATVVWYVRDDATRRTAANVAALEQTVQGGVPTIKPVILRSTLGFSVAVDLRRSVVTASTDQAATKNSVYDGAELATTRAYRQVVVTSSGVAGAAAYGSSLVISVDPEASRTPRADDVAKALSANQLASQVPAGYRAERIGEGQKIYGDVSFAQVTQREISTITSPRGGGLVLVNRVVEVYAGVLDNGAPITIRLSVPDEGPAALRESYDAILQTLSTNTFVGASTSSAVGHVKQSDALDNLTREWARRFGLLPTLAHASQPVFLDEAQLVARNAPAVVKLYHVACGVLTYRGQKVTTGACSASTGSGFLISSDGYIATSGHVVSSDPKESVVNGMSAELLFRLLAIDGYRTAEINDIVSLLSGDTQAKNTIAEAIYRLPDDVLRYENQRDLYVVALSDIAPDLKALMADPSSFKETGTLKQAHLKAMDYNPADLFNADGFTHSDVALLKVEGKNYPMVHLGSLNSIVQGAGVTVIGYPSDAETNALIRGGAVQSTATKGIVSAIRQVSGSPDKVIQSDVNIGHGNSGGPAFDQSGNVFGVATYVLSGSSEGGAGITYLRDIQDVRDLVRAQSITLARASQTQELWESGLRDFYSARYAQAIKKFGAVRRLYPSHTTASTYISIAEDKIAQGEQARSVWIPISIVVGLLVSITGVVVASVMIIRHRAHYHMFKAVQSGYLHAPFVHIQTVKRQHAAKA